MIYINVCVRVGSLETVMVLGTVVAVDEIFHFDVRR